MKKETTLSVLKEIRNDMKEFVDSFKKKIEITEPISKIVNKNDYFEVIDTPDKKTSELLNECRKHFTVYSFYTDRQLDSDFPPPNKKTVRYFKANIEADEENAGKSANELKDKPGITLRERIILELQYFLDTGNHLDIYNITLCSGSRFSVGVVPDAFWGDGKFCVRWNDPDDRDECLRSRLAVSLKS